MRVGIMTGGGDAPGLNAVIRAFVKRGVGQLGLEVVGIEDSLAGLLHKPPGVRNLMPRDCRGLLQRGGTVLGTTNHGDPFAFPQKGGSVRDRSGDIADTLRALGIEGLVSIGGDGSQRIAMRLMRERGIPVIGVPKTIDNDLAATDITFGFRSAVDVATDALDRLHTTAESHDRVMLLEVMGRDTGHIALEAGIAGGADVILLPEIPYVPARVASKIHRRRAMGRTFTIIVVAEGALPVGASHADRAAALKRGGGASAIVVEALKPFVDSEMRVTVLGHLQRGGSPIAYDRVLATRFGVAAAEAVAAGEWGKMVRLHNGVVDLVPLEQAVAANRYVDPDGDLVRVARATGVEFGA